MTAWLLRLAYVYAPWIDEAALSIYVGGEIAVRLAQRPSEAVSKLTLIRKIGP